MSDYGTAGELYTRIAAAWRPPSALKPSEWADEYRVLSAGSAEPGRWRTLRTPYLRAIMDSVKEQGIKEVWWMACAQVGKSEAVNNVLGYYIANDPGSILFVQPTVEMAQSYSKDRLQPMFRDTPTLREQISEARESGSENTILHKAYNGGTLDLAGANSAAGLASRPKRIVLCDEVDRYPASAGEEGDPVLLAKKRSATFWNRIFVAVSTPTIAGISRIEKGWLSGDQRRYYVPCPLCSEFITLEWERLDYSTHGTTQSPVYLCPCCDGKIEQHHKPRMIARGEWRAGAPFAGIASFHINQLYSPFSDWTNVVEEWLQAKALGPHAIKTWKNTALGLPYEEQGATFHAEAIAARAEDTTGGTLPAEALVLTAGIDVQGDRIECEVVAWWDGDQSYSVDYLVLAGNPKERKLWDDLDLVLKTRYTTADGRSLGVPIAAIDAGDGNTSDQVMAFAAARQTVTRNAARGVVAVKGSTRFDAPVWQRPTPRKDGLPNPWMLGVSQIKIRVYDMLKVEDAGPGYMRFPAGRSDKYYAGLTSEKLITRRDKRGFPVKEWHKVRERNEPLDCRVYAYAALKILNPNYDILASAKPAKNAEKPKETPQSRPTAAKKRPRMAIRL